VWGILNTLGFLRDVNVTRKREEWREPEGGAVDLTDQHRGRRGSAC